MKTPVLLLGLCLVFIAGCDDSKSQKAKQEAAAAQARDEAEHKLMIDPSRGIPELKRRLRESLKFQDGLVLVNSPFGLGTLAGTADALDRYILPASTPWSLSCGMGMTVSFGPAISGGDGSPVSNDVQVALTLARIDKSQCASFGLAVGKEIQAILQGQRGIAGAEQ